MQLTYSSNPRSELNTARWLYELARTMRRYANKGYGSMSVATRHWNIARARLARAIKGRLPAVTYEPDLTTRIAGIPCGIVITYYSAPRCNNWGHPDNREPDDPAEVEFFVIDRKGYPAGWLERKADYAELKAWVLANV